MATDTKVVEPDFDTAWDRCADLDGNEEELKILGTIVRSTYNNDQDEELEILCKAMLRHDQLPSLYKAKMFTYLSTLEDYDSFDYLTVASS